MWLQERKIPYKERKISEGNVAKELMLLGYRTTPVIMIDEEIVVGFDPVKLAKALENESCVEREYN